MGFSDSESESSLAAFLLTALAFPFLGASESSSLSSLAAFFKGTFLVFLLSSESESESSFFLVGFFCAFTGFTGSSSEESESSFFALAFDFLFESLLGFLFDFKRLTEFESSETALSFLFAGDFLVVFVGLVFTGSSSESESSKRASTLEFLVFFLCLVAKC